LANIVVIDDDPDLRRTMCRILERDGHSVRSAENGRAGLELVAREVPDLVVTDLLMPEKEGIETIVELREKHPDLRIVAVSGAGGKGEDGPLMDAELLGADAALPKPFSVEEFLETVERVLAGRPRSP
jgi:CheY-like chemotaxis protein